MMNISLKLFEIWTSGSADVILRYFLSTSLSGSLVHRGKSFRQFC